MCVRSEGAAAPGEGGARHRGPARVGTGGRGLLRRAEPGRACCCLDPARSRPRWGIWPPTPAGISFPELTGKKGRT